MNLDQLTQQFIDQTSQTLKSEEENMFHKINPHCGDNVTASVGSNTKVIITHHQNNEIPPGTNALSDS